MQALIQKIRNVWLVFVCFMNFFLIISEENNQPYLIVKKAIFHFKIFYISMGHNQIISGVADVSESVLEENTSRCGLLIAHLNVKPVGD